MEEDTWDYFPCVSHTYLTYTLPHIHNTHICRERERERKKEKKKGRESLESPKPSQEKPLRDTTKLEER